MNQGRRGLAALFLLTGLPATLLSVRTAGAAPSRGVGLTLLPLSVTGPIGQSLGQMLWRVLGAHVREYAGLIGTVTGTSFAVWAPSAQAVRVVA